MEAQIYSWADIYCFERYGLLGTTREWLPIPSSLFQWEGRKREDKNEPNI